jgi:multidrug efflux pump subunit AcrA (membrane-fusion protein)
MDQETLNPGQEPQPASPSMSTESSYQPEMVDQTRQQIRGLVQEIEGLVRTEVSPEEFYEGFLHRVVAALAAIGGAVWTLDEEGRLALSAQINLAETRLHESQEEQQHHGKLLRKILTGGQGAVVKPRYASGEDDASNPTDALLVLGILKSDTETRGLVEIFQRPGARPAVERGYLRFVMQMCELAEDYLKTRQLRLYTDRQAIWTQLEQFTRLAHGSLDPRATAYTLANEGRRLIECDRVSVAISRGRHTRIEAVSGQETFDKRSNTVALLGKLATVVVKAGEPLWYTGDTRDLAPQVEAAVEDYVDESHTKTVVVLPLAKPHDPEEEEVESAPPHKPEYVGALIVEQINTDGIPATMRRRIEVVTEHGSTALTNALEHNSLFLMPVWRTLGKSKVLISARMLPKTLAAIVAVLAILVSLFFIPAEFQLHGKGTLEPVEKRDVFAEVDGLVEKILVKHGDDVKAGQPLVVMMSDKLGADIADYSGKKEGADAKILTLENNRNNEKFSAAEREKNAGELQVAKAERNGIAEHLALLLKEREKLTVRSPIDGKVVTFKIDDLLRNRPIEKGQILVTVIDPTKDWQLEVFMPEDRMGHIKRAQRDLNKKDLDVNYIMAADPGHTLHGKLEEVHESAEVQGEEGNTVKVLVTINKEDLNPELLTKGAGVSAKVDCGRRNLGYVWFHDVLEFIQSKILFKL